MTFDKYQKEIQTITVVENCPVAKTLELLSGKWISRIIFELQKHDCIRFGELKRNISGITNTMLSTSLKTLEKHQLVERRQFNEIPPHVEYSLTSAGKAMLPIYYEMAKWSALYMNEKSQTVETNVSRV